MIKLTQYSHGAGCGCKIAPTVLSAILKNHEATPDDKRLLVGNSSRDDAAAYDLGNGTALISTTDFFMPIVDSPFEFGRIAATNAISDVYAMGAKPILAIAILGWPIDKLDATVANEVIAGGRKACADAGIVLAGGHSIDCPEPVFGLAVNGIVDISNLKRNDTAKEGDVIFLTKKIGVGVLSTANKKGIIAAGHLQVAIDSMTTLNNIGEALGHCKAVNALTDVTGFGLLGHLIEMAEGSNLKAVINYSTIPVLDYVSLYLENGCIPGGTVRNFKSYGHKVQMPDEEMKNLLCDPQTSGGLLVAVAKSNMNEFIAVMGNHFFVEIGKMEKREDDYPVVVIE
ncbi:MAG: selenide, water dikinase SelD [Bacteroidetes bacterium]|nr:selenide, water dikinase SelD [Bacteroidota bacterium]